MTEEKGPDEIDKPIISDIRMSEETGPEEIDQPIINDDIMMTVKTEPEEIDQPIIDDDIMMTVKTEPEETDKPIINDDIKFVGERNAIVFNASAGEPIPPEELPDDFFDLKKDDIRVLYKEIKENRERLEKMPFRTKAVRDMEENAATLSRLNRYTRTVLRIQFPDQNVLQAVFNHSETIQLVKDFVRTFLDPSDVQFQLYTAPPKSILQPEMTLIESKLTPRALVYFSADLPQCQTTFLKAELLSSLTKPPLASEAALQYRRKEARDERSEESATTPEPIPSTSSAACSSASSSKASTTVPKWFKR